MVDIALVAPACTVAQEREVEWIWRLGALATTLHSANYLFSGSTALGSGTGTPC